MTTLKGLEALRIAAAFAAAILMLGQPGVAATQLAPSLAAQIDARGLSPDALAVLDAFEQGRTEDAQARLRALLAVRPPDPSALLIRGFLRLETDPQGAIDDAARVLVMAGPRKDALDLMGQAFARFRRVAPSDAVDAEARAVEIATYEKLQRAYPDWPELLFRSASQRIALERLRPDAYDQLPVAVGELETVVAVLPDGAPARTRAQAHFQLARAYKHLEDSRPTPGREEGPLPENYRLAVSHFDMVLRIDPTRLDSLGETVLVFRELGRFEDALVRLRAGYDYFPQAALQAKLMEMEGGLLVDLGQHDAAIDVFERAVAADPTRDGAHLALAQLQLHAGAADAARHALDAAAALRPRTLDIHAARARLASPDDPAVAEAAWTALLAVAPTDAVTLGMRPSPERYRTALYAEASLRLAEIRADQGRAGEAAALLAQARDLGAAPDAVAALDASLEVQGPRAP